MKEPGPIRRAYRLLPFPVRACVYAAKLRLTGGGGDPKKQEVVRSYLRTYGISCFIETGTFVGDMVEAIRPLARQAYSIELQDHFYQVCRMRFLFRRNVQILKGDSGKILPTILENVRGPALFWLDGHYSGGDTAKGDLETPIMEELRAIRDHGINTHVILIDDVRHFGQGDYPKIETLCELLKSINNAYQIEIKDDILRACP